MRKRTMDEVYQIARSYRAGKGKNNKLSPKMPVFRPMEDEEAVRLLQNVNAGNINRPHPDILRAYAEIGSLEGLEIAFAPWCEAMNKRIY